MDETPTAPALSPSFNRARKLSRIMAVLFSISFWLTAALLACIPVILIWPLSGSIMINDTEVSFANLSRGQHLMAFLAVVTNLVPGLFLMHHLRRLFGAFAQGAVFAPASISHIRSIGIWLVVCFFAGAATVPLMIGAGLHDPAQMSLDFWPLVTGIVTTIAAHVMTEASRIAADHAEIV